MNLGDKLIELRKIKGYSQEEVAEILGVTRQTISKWETDQSKPDFDKIVPLCELYNISTEELLTGNKLEVSNEITIDKEEILKNKQKKAKGIGIGILLYFISIIWTMISIPVLEIDPVISSSVFLLICGIATFIIVYTCIMYKTEKTKSLKKQNKLMRQIQLIICFITLIIYLIVSFLSNAWHITWILWIVMILIIEIVKLIFMLRGEENE